jgi:hypothetical protein
MRKLLAQDRITVEVPFQGDTLQVKELSVAEIKTFQKTVKTLNDDKKADNEDKALGTQRELIRLAVVDANDMTDEELDTFPLKALSALCNRILEINGLASNMNDEPDADGEVGNA